ncbi:hypothetical protein RRG08_008626 [Elysia crispata]|uniref:Uncharacterized protein n=1 Tax=Elysia crispata TaxID=231223 RepID=A0AAE1B791_9GAST|nr:hypothetical protein RRG08_008626 [Elysia crispata]
MRACLGELSNLGTGRIVNETGGASSVADHSPPPAQTEMGRKDESCSKVEGLVNSRMREHNSDVKQCQVCQNPIEIASTEPSFEERETRSEIDPQRVHNYTLFYRIKRGGGVAPGVIIHVVFARQ